MAELLIENHIDVNLAGTDGDTALTWAANRGKKGLPRFLYFVELIKTNNSQVQ